MLIYYKLKKNEENNRFYYLNLFKYILNKFAKKYSLC